MNTISASASGSGSAERGPGVARVLVLAAPLQRVAGREVRSPRSAARTRLNSWLGKPDRGSAWTVSVGKRSRRITTGSSHSTSAPDTTWLSGIIRPATGLQICMLLIARRRRSARASGGRATIGSSRVSCGNIPRRRRRARGRSRRAAFEAPVSSAWATSTRVMPLRRACSSSSSGRITFSRSRQSLRTHMALPSSSDRSHRLIGRAAGAPPGRVLGTAPECGRPGPGRAGTSWRSRWRSGTARRDASGCRRSARRSSFASSTSTRNCTNARFSVSGRVDEQEPQPAAADERRDVRHARLRLDVFFDRGRGERLRSRGCACRPAGRRRP